MTLCILSSRQNSSERNVLEELAQGVSAMPAPSAIPEQDMKVAPPTGGEGKPQEKIDDVSEIKLHVLYLQCN